MMFDTSLWEQLVQRGLTTEHLRALLDFLTYGRPGFFAWYGRNGQLDHCKLELTFPSRYHDLQEMSTLLLHEDVE